MATPSSKPNPGATPTHLTSSPRPSGPMTRPMSHKSPSTRTPSASGHGQTHQPTLPQYATPLAATAGADDPVTFSSPSALLALGGYSGISPSPAGHDGLVAPGMNESEIQALGMQGLKLGNARDSDEERRRHIEDVVQLLRTRVAGRGVCREGIERLGQLEGFESIWQEDNLNIAGNFVDLEIEFYRGQNAVQDVSLKYATPEAADGERREEATAVLSRDLTQPEGDNGPWKSLAGFHENLQWLSRHDRLSQEVNCFEAIEGLYESLKRVWHEEGNHREFSGVYDHLCRGLVGRPCLHKEGRIGLSLDYWVQQARVQDAKQKKKQSADDMMVDQPSDEEMVDQNGRWHVIVECEEGYPSLRVSKDWVGPEVMTVVNNNNTTNENEPSSSDNAGSNIAVVNWTDPPATLASNTNSDAMALDSNMLGSAPNRRFVARMEPPLDLPILAASDIYRHLGIQMPQEFKMVTYDGLLAPGWSPLAAAGALGLGPEEASQLGRKRRRMPVQAVDMEGKPCTKQHSYTFQPFESVAGRTMRDIPFAHPRQLAEILPILRQYAFLANMIRSIFSPSNKENDGEKESQTDESKSKQPSKPAGKGLIILSNDNPNERKLDWLLKGAGNAAGITSGKEKAHGRADGNFGTEDDVKVDVTLRTQLGQAPVIMLLFTVDNTTPESPSGQPMLSKVSISLEIGLDARVSVVDMTGLLDDETTRNENDMDVQTEDGQRKEAFELQNKIARVLEMSQDIGILVEWILRWVRQRKDR